MGGAPFDKYYRTTLHQLGLFLSDDDGLEEDPSANLPDALRAWYRIARWFLRIGWIAVKE